MRMVARALRPLLVVLLLPHTSAAQPEAAPSTTGETGLFTLLSPDTLPRRNWSFGLYYSNRDRLVGLDDSAFPGVSDPEIDWRRLSASFGYGLTDRWEVSAALPFDDYAYFHEEGPFGKALDTAGANNLRLAGKYRFWDRPAADTRLAIDLFAELPTGDRDEVASDKLGFGVLLAGRTRAFFYNAGVRHPGNDDNFDNPRQLLLSGGYSRVIVERLDWISEVAGTFLTGGDETPTRIRNSLDVTTGGRLWFQNDRRWSVNFAARVNAVGLSGLGGLVGVTFGNR
jgi:hypothetical protein